MIDDNTDLIKLEDHGLNQVKEIITASGFKLLTIPKKIPKDGWYNHHLINTMTIAVNYAFKVQNLKSNQIYYLMFRVTRGKLKFNPKNKFPMEQDDLSDNPDWKYWKMNYVTYWHKCSHMVNEYFILLGNELINDKGNEVDDNFAIATLSSLPTFLATLK